MSLTQEKCVALPLSIIAQYFEEVSLYIKIAVTQRHTIEVAKSINNSFLIGLLMRSRAFCLINLVEQKLVISLFNA